MKIDSDVFHPANLPSDLIGGVEIGSNYERVDELRVASAPRKQEENPASINVLSHATFRGIHNRSREKEYDSRQRW